LTLEPAAQLEVSFDAQRDIREIEREYDSFCEEVNEVIHPMGLELATYGYHPASRIDELELIPKTRYMQMAEYLPTKGRYALNMMKGTASVQVSIDYTCEEDFKRKFRLANCLSPFFYFITDNSPYFEGKPVDRHMLRARIWDEVDPDRSGIIAGALDLPFGYRDYAAAIYAKPSVVTHRNGELQYTKEILLNELFRNGVMSQEDIDYAMGMFFPDVRVRHYIEIRMADSLPKQYMLAYTALVKGLFYNQANTDKYLSIFSGITNKDAARIKSD
jgi:glutamate--cysteine ligase